MVRFQTSEHILVKLLRLFSALGHGPPVRHLEKAAGGRRAYPSDTGLVLWREVGYQEIGWKYVR